MEAWDWLQAMAPPHLQVQDFWFLHLPFILLCHMSVTTSYLCEAPPRFKGKHLVLQGPVMLSLIPWPKRLHCSLASSSSCSLWCDAVVPYQVPRAAFGVMLCPHSASHSSWPCSIMVVRLSLLRELTAAEQFPVYSFSEWIALVSDSQS